MKNWLVLLLSTGLLLGACSVDAGRTAAPEHDSSVEVTVKEAADRQPETEEESVEAEHTILQDKRHSEEGKLDDIAQAPDTYKSQAELTETTTEVETSVEAVGGVEQEAVSVEKPESEPTAPAVQDEVETEEAELESDQSETTVFKKSGKEDNEQNPIVSQPELNSQPEAPAEPKVSSETDPAPAVPPIQEREERSIVEDENYALEQVTSLTNLLSEEYIYFSEMQENNWVQVEIRESVTDGVVEWTNLIGIYRYNVETDQMETLTTAGEFE